MTLAIIRRTIVNISVDREAHKQWLPLQVDGNETVIAVEPWGSAGAIAVTTVEYRSERA